MAAPPPRRVRRRAGEPARAEPAGPGADPALLAASEAAAAEREATAAAVALVLASATAKAEATAAEAAAAAPPDPGLLDGDQFQRRSRRAAIRGFAGMLVRGIAVLALFIGGIALGAAAFQRSDQAAAAAPIVDPAVDGARRRRSSSRSSSRPLPAATPIRSGRRCRPSPTPG